ncbi:DUF7948 domain-containing protein [Candidatus Nitrospira allomarina]|uniref:DUF7948 domain-containing protein n=1 Tax=Candidatus Nitrospira allomarina TaxID=3020900 RepID=UPI003F8D23BC
MRFLQYLFLVLASGSFLILPSCTTNEPDFYKALNPSFPSPHSTFSHTPLSFEANQGQTDSHVQYLSRGNGYNLFLTSNEAVLTLTKADQTNTGTAESANKSEPRRTATVRMQLVTSNPFPTIAGERKLSGKAHYFKGNDPNKWQKNVSTYAQVRYAEIYPGIDLVYYGNQQQLEYDFIIAPGKDPASITINFQGVDTLNIDPNGDLLLQTPGGTIRQRKPVIYQKINEKKQIIRGHYLVKSSHQVGFQVEKYDPTKALIIDPVISFSTYLGGSKTERLQAIAVDSKKQVYITGHTLSTNFPTANPIQASNMGGSPSAPDSSQSDVFIAKFTADGSELIYSTYLGGSNIDEGRDIAVDADGNAYVTGRTSSDNFPIMNPFQGTKAESADAFVTKLASDGSSLIYSTFLGGSSHEELFLFGHDAATGIAVDAAGSAYITGFTGSDDFPLKNAIQPQNAGGFLASGPGGDAFVTKLSPDGTALIYSTYLGGGVNPEGLVDQGYDAGMAIAVDRTGHAYITGVTVSDFFPTVNAFQENLLGYSDIFLTKLSPDGSAFIYSTYLGGSIGPIDGLESHLEQATGIAVDDAGHAYLAGWTNSNDFPTANALQSDALESNTNFTQQAGFVTKFTINGSGLIYSTYLSGSEPFRDQANAIAVDAAGNAYVTGQAASSDFPTTPDAIQKTKSGFQAAFVTVITPDGSALSYSSYLGGSDNDSGIDIALDSSRNIYVAGQTESTDFPIMNPFQAFNAGVIDGFVMKIATDNIAPTVEAGPAQTIILPNIANLNGSVSDDGLPDPPGTVLTIWEKVSGPGTVTFADPSAVKTTARFSLPGTYVVRLTADDGDLTASDEISITVNPPPPLINQAPMVDAGPMQTIFLPGQALLNGTVTDDGLPNPPGTVMTTWSKVSGPNVVAFGNPNAVDTTVLFFSAGTYVLRLTASDGALSRSSDVTITARDQGTSSPSSDVNGDGKADIVWRNTNGMVAIWLMNGVTITSTGFPGGVATEWQIKGVGDVDGDGKADVIWRHGTSGATAIWLMNGVTRRSVGFPGSPSTDWEIQAVGDVNGDGKADIVWRNSRGATAIWFMNGPTIASAGFPGGVPLAWQIKGVGDVNGDGKADVIWRHGTSGTVAIWLMNGLTITSVGFPGSAPNIWTVNEVDDVDGDGKADVIWRHGTSGATAIWLMNGATIASSGFPGAMPSEWKIEQVGDVDGDGKADIVWRNSRPGEVEVWIMNGLTITTKGSPGTASTGWEIQ